MLTLSQGLTLEIFGNEFPILDTEPNVSKKIVIEVGTIAPAKPMNFNAFFR